MAALSESYPKTLALLADGKTEEAAKEFHGHFAATVKKLYIESATVYPSRFAKIETWCDWTQHLYIMTRQAEGALNKGDKSAALGKLEALREHFNTLHVTAQTQKANDYIYAIQMLLKKSKPEADQLSQLAAALEKAPPSAKVQAQAEQYARARMQWAQQATPILKNGIIDQAELNRLRENTRQFYQEFGIQFE